MKVVRLLKDRRGDCPVCQKLDTEKKWDLYDDRYGFPGFFPLLICNYCGHRFLDATFSPEDLRRMYTDYYPRASFSLEQFKSHDEINNKFKKWLEGANCNAFRFVPPKVRVLDIGCGFGESLGYHKDRGCDVYGVEADENTRKVAEKYGFTVKIGLFDSQDYQEGFFDYITLDQVLEHVTDPHDNLSGVGNILKPDGRVIISTPNSNGWGARLFGRQWINWHTPYHLQFFSIDSMKMAAEKAGLAVEKVYTITSSEWLFYQWMHLITIPPMGIVSGFWAPKQSLPILKKFGFELLRLIHKTKLNHLITRVFDGLGMGDNYVFILRK